MRSPNTYKSDLGIVPFTKLRRLAMALEEHLVSNPDGIELPGNLGILKVIGRRTRKPMVNKLASRRMGKRIYYTNEDTDGYFFTVVWNGRTKGLRQVRTLRFSRLLHFSPGHRLRKLIHSKVTKDPYFYHREE